MTTKTDKQKIEEKLENKFNASEYSCEVVLERTTKEKANDKSFPTDAFNVTYIYEGQTYLDVTRSEKMVNVFDMYYDRYGKGAVQRIDYGSGTIRPNLWGVKAPTKQSKRRK